MCFLANTKLFKYTITSSLMFHGPAFICGLISKQHYCSKMGFGMLVTSIIDNAFECNVINLVKGASLSYLREVYLKMLYI